MNVIYRYYKSLDLEPEASREEVKKAYRDLIKVWHPDRFQDNQRLQKKANDKLVEINEAYEKITLHISHKEQIIREKPEEPIYEAQSERYNQAFSDIDLISLLGKSINSIEVNQYISTLNEPPTIKSKIINGNYLRYEFIKNSIEMIIEMNILKTIILYCKRVEGIIVRQYIGSIPYNLTFFDNRQTLHNKLGLPSKSMNLDKDCWDYWVFPPYSIRIAYDENRRMSWINLNEVWPFKGKENRNWWQALWKGR